jgi:hypothetical protein
MSTEEPAHRSYHQAPADQITVRETGDGEDGVFVVRMPIASTGEVRNEGDDPLSRAAVDGMAEQVAEGTVGVFIDHGQSTLGGGGGMLGNRYSAIGKVGEWENPTVVDAGEREDGADDSALLVADARLMDPETLPAASGAVREALAAIKSQVERGFSLSSSIGWREDDTFPGGNDLMEASIVGIGADPRTTSDAAAGAVARAAVDAGADPEALVDAVRAVVMGPTDGREADESMGNDDTPTDEQSEGTTDGAEESEQREAPAWAERLIEQQEQQTDLLQSVHDAVREDGEDEDDEEEDDDSEENADDGEDDEDDEESEQSAAPDEGERTLTVDGEDVTAEDIRALRESAAAAEPDVSTDDTTADDEPTREAEGDEPTGARDEVRRLMR